MQYIHKGAMSASEQLLYHFISVVILMLNTQHHILNSTEVLFATLFTAMKNNCLLRKNHSNAKLKITQF